MRMRFIAFTFFIILRIILLKIPLTVKQNHFPFGEHAFVFGITEAHCGSFDGRVQDILQCDSQIE